MIGRLYRPARTPALLYLHLSYLIYLISATGWTHYVMLCINDTETYLYARNEPLLSGSAGLNRVRLSWPP